MGFECSLAVLFANLIGVHPFESLRVDAFTAQCVLTYLTPLLAFDVVAGVLVPRALAAQGSDAEGAVDEYRDLFAKARERAGSPAERGAEALQRLTLLAPSPRAASVLLVASGLRGMPSSSGKLTRGLTL